MPAFAIALLSVLAISQRNVASSTTDSDFIHNIVGQWIVSPGSSDYSPVNAQMLEAFDPDGTYTVRLYEDLHCGRVVAQTKVSWAIREGILTTTYADGSTDRDQVVSVGKQEMVLRSLNDKVNYSRVRAPSCSQPIS